MAKKKAKIKKSWYKLMAPSIFNNIEVSETLTDDISKLNNRKMKIELRKLMPNTDKNYANVFLQVKKIEGDQAQTVLYGHDCAREYIYRLSRKGTDRLDVIEDVKTKDGARVRVKAVAITLRKTETATKKDVGAKIREIIQKEATSKDFDKFMHEIFLNGLQKKILKAVKTIYPLRVLEIRKTEVL